MVDRNGNAYGLMNLSIDAASVTATASSEEQTFSAPGLTTDMFVLVNKPSLSAGLGIGNARVSANDTLALTYVNATDAAVDPAVETYKVFWWKPNVTDEGAAKV